MTGTMIRWLFYIGLVYEALALATPLPTITTIVHSARSNTVTDAYATAMVIATLTILFWHLLLENR